MHIPVNDADEKQNSVDPDQTAPNYEQSDQGLHCFAFHLHRLQVYAFTAMGQPICPSILDFYGNQYRIRVFSLM